MAVWVPSILLFLLAAGLAGHAVFLYRAGRRALREGEASVAWPRTPGRVVASQVQHQSDGSFGGAQPGYYIPWVSYQYAVGDLTYTGTRIAVRDLRGRRKTAAALVTRYPAGGEVAVSYDPAAPESSLLEPGTAGTGWTFAFAALEVLVSLAITATGILIPLLGQHP